MGAPAEAPSEPTGGGDDEGGQTQSSLIILTHNCIDYMTAHRGEEQELSVVAERLRVPKQRLYDAVNVLDGVGVIGRRENRIRWLGRVPVPPLPPADLNPQEAALQRAIDGLDLELDDLMESGLWLELSWVSTGEIISLFEPGMDLYKLHGPKEMELESWWVEGRPTIHCSAKSIIEFSPVHMAGDPEPEPEAAPPAPIEGSWRPGWGDSGLVFEEPLEAEEKEEAEGDCQGGEGQGAAGAA
jgi:hypothetical protein